MDPKRLLDKQKQLDAWCLAHRWWLLAFAAAYLLVFASITLWRHRFSQGDLWIALGPAALMVFPIWALLVIRSGRQGRS